MGNFGQSEKGGTLCKNLKIGHFFGANLKGYKILNTSRILASLVWMDAEFTLVSIDTIISMKLKMVLKMGIFGQSAKGGPFAKISKLAIFLDQI